MVKIGHTARSIPEKKLVFLLKNVEYMSVGKAFLPALQPPLRHGRSNNYGFFGLDG